MAKRCSKVTKTELAKKLGVSRSSLYYKRKQPIIDEEVKNQIESVLSNNPAYGHKRISIQLKLNKKRILRVMKKFGIKPYRRRIKKPRKKGDEKKKPTKYKNLIKDFCPLVPGIIWVTDFTYIKYKNKFIYFCTLMDLSTREIVGWNISRFHNSEFVLGALEQALENYDPPIYLHSDQGSEYDSQVYTNLAERVGIIISMSKKGSPWENGFQESFYSQFKLELSDPDRFELLGELIEAIHQQVMYYNERRIHTSLKMSPKKYRKYLQKKFRLRV